AERVVGKLARGLAGVARSKGVDVIGGRAVFEDSRGLRVEGEEPQKIRFKHAIVATGSAPATLPALATTSDRVMDSTSALAVADGGRPQSAGLGLETTRGGVDERACVVIDTHCRTGDPHIYAVGDVTGEPLLAHRAMRQGKVVAEVIAGRPAAFDNVAVPAVVFTDPEVAWCGVTEGAAESAGRPVKIARFSWAASGRAATLGRSDGLTKMIADPE